MKREPVKRAAFPKYQEIVDALSRDIRSGRYSRGQKLPSEAALVKKFSTSRITVGRAMRELRQLGLIERKAGSGSYVRLEHRGGKSSLLFGLLIPDLGETEIFDPICQGIAGAPLSGEHALLWGHSDLAGSTKEEQAWQLCTQFIARDVAGVFFAPLEFEPDAERTNHRILASLRQAGIPVVLLDRRPSTMPERRRPDLVGINNRQAGYVATEHLIRLGLKRIVFLAYHGSAATIEGRMAGFEEALRKHGLASATEALMADDERFATSLEKQDVEGFVCVNDRVAGQLMHVFLARSIRVPEDIRIVGIDDLPYASLLPVPLTTVHQPCREIGESALAVMLDRIDRPHLPPRDVLLDGELVVRQSCGSSLSAQSLKAEIETAR